MDCNTPGSSVHGIFRQVHWSKLPFPTSGDLPNPGLADGSPALADGFFTTEPPGYNNSTFSSVQSLSCVRLFATAWTAACQASLFFTISQSFLKLMSIESVISFRIDWFDFLAVQRSLKSLLQHHSLKASILWLLAFFMVQLSHPYLAYGKTIALAIQTFVSKVMSLIFNTLSRFVIAFLPRNKCLLISWLQPLSTVILEPKKIKSVTASMFSPSIAI